MCGGFLVFVFGLVRLLAVLSVQCVVSVLWAVVVRVMMSVSVLDLVLDVRFWSRLLS